MRLQTQRIEASMPAHVFAEASALAAKQRRTVWARHAGQWHEVRFIRNVPVPRTAKVRPAIKRVPMHHHDEKILEAVHQNREMPREEIITTVGESLGSEVQRKQISKRIRSLADRGALVRRYDARARVMLRYSLNADGNDNRVLLF